MGIDRTASSITLKDGTSTQHRPAGGVQCGSIHVGHRLPVAGTSPVFSALYDGVVFLIDPLRISRIVSCRFGCFFPRFSDISGHWHWFQFRFDPHAFLSGDRRSARRLPRRFRKAMAAAAAAIIRFGRTSFRLARAPSRVSGSCRSSPWHRPAGPAGPVCRFARGRLRPCPPRCRNRSRNRCA